MRPGAWRPRLPAFWPHRTPPSGRTVAVAVAAAVAASAALAAASVAALAETARAASAAAGSAAFVVAAALAPPPPAGALSRPAVSRCSLLGRLVGAVVVAEVAGGRGVGASRAACAAPAECLERRAGAGERRPDAGWEAGWRTAAALVELHRLRCCTLRVRQRRIPPKGRVRGGRGGAGLGRPGRPDRLARLARSAGPACLDHP